MTEKYLKNGRIAVLYSPGFGAGWSTWGVNEMAYDKELIEAFIEGGKEKLREITKLKYPNQCILGLRDVVLTWIKQGTFFRINEYDGSESIETHDDDSWIKA